MNADEKLSDDGWVQTFTGRQFWPLSPRAEHVCIEDIAHALSLLCRFTGHVREFYSVAHHSVLVCSYVMEKMGRAMDHRVAMTALMHDAAEAYIADIARPVKHRLIGFREHEERIEVAIAQRFDLFYPFPAIVKEADNVLLNTERRDLMATPPRPWNTHGVGELAHAIIPWRSAVAEVAFLTRFKMLSNYEVR